MMQQPVTLLSFVTTVVFVNFAAFLLHYPTTQRSILTVPETEKALDFTTTCPERPLRIFILVLSAPGNVEKRDTIRNTWMLAYDSKQVTVTVRFIVGTKLLSAKQVEELQQENDKSNDLIIVEDLKDSYGNLAEKNIKAIQWVNETSPEFDYYMKSDDDNYIQITELDSVLRGLNCTKKLYMGSYNVKMSIFYNGAKTDRSWFFCKTYLPYTSGAGYIMSRDVVVDMLIPFSSRLRLRPFEDMSTGYWLAPYKLNKVHTSAVNVFWDVKCCNKYIVFNHLEPKGIREKYDTYLKRGKPCPESMDHSYIKGYTVNMNALPANCCSEVTDKLVL